MVRVKLKDEKKFNIYGFFSGKNKLIKEVTNNNKYFLKVRQLVS